MPPSTLQGGPAQVGRAPHPSVIHENRQGNTALPSSWSGQFRRNVTGTVPSAAGPPSTGRLRPVASSRSPSMR